MIPARIPRVARTSPRQPLSSSSYAEADYCIALRIWDVLLWFAIMQRPRRDVGICADFANTLAEYSIQLLLRSIFPFDLVPMTRIDPIQKVQVRRMQHTHTHTLYNCYMSLRLSLSLSLSLRCSWRLSSKTTSMEGASSGL
jgi:hypothetical protein